MHSDVFGKHVLLLPSVLDVWLLQLFGRAYVFVSHGIMGTNVQFSIYHVMQENMILIGSDYLPLEEVSSQLRVRSLSLVSVSSGSLLLLVSNGYSLSVCSLILNDLSSNSFALFVLGELYIRNVASVKFSSLGQGTFAFVVRSGCHSVDSDACIETGLADMSSLLISRLLMPDFSNLFFPEPVIVSLFELQILEESTSLLVRGIALDAPLNFRCSLQFNTPQNVSILCLSYFNMSASQSSSSVPAMHDSCEPSVPGYNMNIRCFPSLNLFSSTLSPDSMLLQGGRWPFPGFTEFLFVEFPKVLVPSNFMSLSVSLNRNLRMVYALNPTIGSTFGGYVITFSGVGLNLFGDLKCRVGGMPSLPLKIEFSNVVCPVVPTTMLIKTAELLLSNGTLLQSFSFIGSYGLELKHPLTLQ